MGYYRETQRGHSGRILHPKLPLTSDGTLGLSTSFPVCTFSI